MEEILFNDDKRNQLIINGLRIKLFSWERSAKKTSDVYKNI